MIALKSHVAIVDDDPAMRQAVARLCGASGIPFCSFASAEEFLESDVPDHFAVLILDINLPGFSGFDLQDQLLHRGIQLPVVFITGQDQPHIRERARQRGAAYLTKPFPADLLIAAVRSHMAAGNAVPGHSATPTTQPTTPLPTT